MLGFTAQIQDMNWKQLLAPLLEHLKKKKHTKQLINVIDECSSIPYEE